MRSFAWRVLLVAVTLSLIGGEAAGQTVHYVLAQGSQIVEWCADCDDNRTPAQSLRGSFDLTAIPLSAENGLEAVTAVDWHSDGHVIRASGFVQRVAASQLAIVLDARINDVSTLLTSGRRQPSTDGPLRFILTSPRDGARRTIITIVASPAVTDGPDVDADGVPDASDSCPDLTNADQLDGDTDGVGDACDQCEATAADGPVFADGCGLSQRCPCDGPSTGAEWANHRAYVQCIARELKVLRRDGRVARQEIVDLMQQAARASCGRRVVALR